MASSKTLQETWFAVHFMGNEPLTILDLASWYEAFSADFPIYQEVPVLPTLPFPPNPAGEVTFNFSSGPTAPRILLRSSDLLHYVSLQADRFTFGWRRTEPLGEESSYPGFEHHLPMWRGYLSAMETWRKGRLGGVHAYRLAELGYHNAFPLNHGGTQRRLGERLKFVNVPGRAIQGFQLQWNEPVPRYAGAVVQANAALGIAPPAEPAFLFNFMGYVPLQPLEGRATDALEALHTHILDMYGAAIAPEAF